MDLWITAYSIACVFSAAIVRGYSGFGFSLLSITALSLALPPAEDRARHLHAGDRRQRAHAAGHLARYPLALDRPAAARLRR